MFHADVVTIFPEMIESFLEYGVLGRGIKNGLLSVDACDLREFAYDRHRTVDDRAYGGGPGMVMKYQPLCDAINALKLKEAGSDRKVICMSPQGRQLDQQYVNELVESKGLIILAGRYEGIDERLIESEVDEEISIGDYVLSGGEPAAMVLLDAVARQIPGVLGDMESAKQDSYMDGLLDCPHYTRPETVAGKRVPQVLLNGNHKEIEKWRRKQMLGRTSVRRPDLINAENLSAEDKSLLNDYLEDLAGR